jgi:hypothetical protein
MVFISHVFVRAVQPVLTLNLTPTVIRARKYVAGMSRSFIRFSVRKRTFIYGQGMVTGSV